MEGSFHELDPDGDVVLVLNKQDTDFAVWDESTANPSLSIQGKATAPPIAQENNSQQSALASASMDEPPAAELPTSFKVSSRHLILASPYFRRMLKGGWKESQTLNTDGFVSIPVLDADPQAMLILLNIIHGHASKIPRIITVEMLAKIGILVDYYECSDALDIISDVWIAHYKTMPGPYCRETALWMCIGLCFRKARQFQLATQIAIRSSRAPIHSLGMPIPMGIIDEVNKQREEAIARILGSIDALRDDFLNNRSSCSFECSSMLLGALTKEMHAWNILSRPASPFLGCSFADLAENIRKIRSPQWRTVPPAAPAYSHQPPADHACSLKKLTGPIIDSLESTLVGLSLKTPIKG